MDKLSAYLKDPLFLALLAFIVILAAFNIQQRLRRRIVWKQLAAETGLQFSKHRTSLYRDMQLSGVYRKRPLTLIESVSQRLQADDHLLKMPDKRRNTTMTATDIRLQIAIPQGLKMSLHRIITIGEATRVTGDAEIDRRFNITSEPDWLAPKALAYANIRQKILQLKMGGNISLQGTELLFYQTGRIADGRYLRFLLDFLSDLADALEAIAV